MEVMDDEFTVEAILSVKRVGTQVVYLVRWATFGPSEDTWEPEWIFRYDLELSNMLDNYIEKHKERIKKLKDRARLERLKSKTVQHL